MKERDRDNNEEAIRKPFERFGDVKTVLGRPFNELTAGYVDQIRFQVAEDAIRDSGLSDG